MKAKNKAVRAMRKIKYFTLVLAVAMLAVICVINPSVLAEWVYGEALSADIDLDVNVVVMPWARIVGRKSLARK